MLFTVFTPTYNRAHRLHRVYESLIAQTIRDFEWLIVDDGSTDGTAELVKHWQKNSSLDFEIRYHWQENQHKKVAHNYAVLHSRSELFIVADSDDRFPDDALEIFAHHWFLIPKQQRKLFVGVCGLSAYENGQIVGDIFPGGDWIDSDFQEIRYRYRVRGEKWGANLTEILREHLYPAELPNYVPEGIVWSQIGARYKARFFNQVVRTYFQETTESNSQISHSRTPKDNAHGLVHWKRQTLSNEINWFWNSPILFFMDATRLVRFALHRGSSSDGFWPSSTIGRVLVLFAMPFGFIWWMRDLFVIYRDSL